MGKTIRDRAANRSGKGFAGQNGRGNYGDPWGGESPEQDPFRDVRDIYEDQPESASDDYVWPENEDNDDDD